MRVQLRPLSRQEIRQLDVRAATELGLPTSILMENAGRGAAGWLAELTGQLPPDAGGRPFFSHTSKHFPDGRTGPVAPRVLVLCGPGNNGGDGAVLARHLDSWGFPVRVMWMAEADHLRGDAALQWTILEKSGVDQAAFLDVVPVDDELFDARLAKALAEAEWIVDALLGTGLSRRVEGVMSRVIEAMNRAGRPILALDLPSGLDADTGQPLGMAVRAFATATFAAPKLGFTAHGAAEYTGLVAVIDIGLPRCLLEPYFA